MYKRFLVFDWDTGTTEPNGGMADLTGDFDDAVEAVSLVALSRDWEILDRIEGIWVARRKRKGPFEKDAREQMEVPTDYLLQYDEATNTAYLVRHKMARDGK